MITAPTPTYFLNDPPSPVVQKKLHVLEVRERPVGLVAQRVNEHLEGGQFVQDAVPQVAQSRRLFLNYSTQRRRQIVEFFGAGGVAQLSGDGVQLFGERSQIFPGQDPRNATPVWGEVDGRERRQSLQVELERGTQNLEDVLGERKVIEGGFVVGPGLVVCDRGVEEVVQMKGGVDRSISLAAPAKSGTDWG